NSRSTNGGRLSGNAAFIRLISSVKIRKVERSMTSFFSEANRSNRACCPLSVSWWPFSFRRSASFMKRRPSLQFIDACRKPAHTRSESCQGPPLGLFAGRPPRNVTVGVHSAQAPGWRWPRTQARSHDFEADPIYSRGRGGKHSL